MPGLASCGRGVLRRSVSNSGVVGEVARQLAEQCEGPTASASTIDDSKPIVYQDLLTDLRSLDLAVKKMECAQMDANRMVENLGTIVKSMPANQGQAPELTETQKQTSFTHMRSSLPDSPTYAAFKSELAATRQPKGDQAGQSEIGCYEQGSCTEASIRAQLEEARSSNRMMQRALAAVQRRLLAVEQERDELRIERDYLRTKAPAATAGPAPPGPAASDAGRDRHGGAHLKGLVQRLPLPPPPPAAAGQYLAARAAAAAGRPAPPPSRGDGAAAGLAGLGGLALPPAAAGAGGFAGAGGAGGVAPAGGFGYGLAGGAALGAGGMSPAASIGA